jgi:ABC-type nitrate/sulfonate/bicarbonate transport system substrate-binding protein
MAKGFYKAANLDVEIIPGGPGPTMPQLLLSGQTDLAMGRSDDVIVWSQQGCPSSSSASTWKGTPRPSSSTTTTR